MDGASLEILAIIAEHLEPADIHRWILTTRRIKFALESKLYSRAASLDLERGRPHYLMRAALIQQATVAFRVLLEWAKLEDINTAKIDPSEFLGDYDCSLLRPEELSPSDTSAHLTSLLHIACQLCSQDVAKLVLSRGALPNLLDTYGWSPLHLASWSGNAAVIRVLIYHGADIELRKIWNQPPLFVSLQTAYSGTTPLHQAAARGHLHAVELLLAAGADPKVPCSEGCDTLGAAAKAGHVGIFRRLLEESYETAALTTALKFAAEGENASLVDILLQSGVEPHDAVINAVQRDRLDNLRLLIEAKADLRRNMSEKNPLQVVCSIEATKMILASAPGLSAAVDPGPFHGTPLETLYNYAEQRVPEELEGIGHAAYRGWMPDP